MDVKGDIAEIGVHHGRLFFIIAAAAKGEERCIAIDIFERQFLNLDSSGSGSREIFESHMDSLFPELSPRSVLLPCDSMSIPVSSVRATLFPNGVRLFSVDGGHTTAHVQNDLALAQEAANSGAIILLDDFFGPHWPSVTEGFFKYMSRLNRRLAPFLIFQNKLFLTTHSEHRGVIEALAEYIRTEMAGEANQNWKYTSLCGFQVLSLG
jgi:hypothetical protein